MIMSFFFVFPCYFMIFPIKYTFLYCKIYTKILVQNMILPCDFLIFIKIDSHYLKKTNKLKLGLYV